MILRIVRGRVSEQSLGRLADGFVERYVPIATATPGLVRYHVATRDRGDAHELIVVTFWESIDAALTAYGGDLASVRTLDGLGRDADLASVEYFEVDESQLRRSRDDAAALRIIVGRVAQGADAGIQQDLRARLPELEEHLTEAYVGRRIVGSDVEVLFLSAWHTLPAGFALDEPIWPDIVARYDTYSVAAYVPVVSGAHVG